MKKTILITLILVSMQTLLFSQETLVHDDVAGDTIIPERGQNLKKFSFFYYNIEWFAGKTEGYGANIKYGKSFKTAFGFRYKQKLAKFYSVGYDINYNYALYSIKQDSSKIFPNTTIHKRENLIYNNIGLELYNRFSFGKRGNYIKYFFDIGAYATYGISNYIKQIDEFSTPNANNAKKTKIKNQNLTFIYPYNYGLKARFGYNKLAITGTYRLSNLFKDNYSGTIYYYPELPRYSVGIEIGIF